MNRTIRVTGAFVLTVIPLLSEDPAVEAQRARQAMVAGKYAEAVKIYTRLSTAFPANLDLKRNLGLALHSSADYAGALRCFEYVLQRAPNDRASLLFSGIELSSLHQSAKALANLTRYLNMDSQTPAAFIARGRTFLSMDEFRSAAEDFLKATEMEPDNPKAWEGLGRAYLLAAQAGFQSIEAQAAMSAEWYALLGRSYLGGQQYKLAFRFFREADARSPDLPGVHAGLAAVYEQTGHPDWAATELSKDKEAATVANTAVRRIYLESLGFQRRGAEALAKLASHPQTPEYHSLLGLSYRIQRNDTESVEEYRRALAIAPGSVSIKLELATTLALTKNCTEAVPLLEQVLKADPTSPDANEVRGECLIDQNRPHDAIPFLQAALKQDPRMLPAECALGRAYLHSGDFRSAVVHLRIGAAMGDPAILYQLSQAYRKLGDAANAAAYMAKYKARADQLANAKAESADDILPPN